MKLAIARFLIIILLLSASAAYSAEIIVNRSEDYQPGDTPILGTLRDAIDNRASSGDTIVFRGRGRNLTIDSLLEIPRRLTGLSIQGRATIRAAGTTDAGFFVLADNVRISGITFRNVDLVVQDFQRFPFPINVFVFHNNIMLGMSRLHLSYVHDCRVEDSHFDGRDDAQPPLSIFVSRRCDVIHNRITSRSPLAVAEHDSTDFEFSRNMVFKGGVRTSALSGLFMDNEVHSDRGIVFESPDDAGPYGQLIIRKNTLRRVFGRRTNIEIDENTFNPRRRSRFLTALHVENGDARGSQGPVHIWKNTINESRNGLVYRGLEGAGSAEISDNHLFRCREAGIVLDGGAANLDLRHNDVTGCGSGEVSPSIALNAPILENVIVEDNQTDGALGVGLRIDPPEEGVELQIFDNRTYTSSTAGILIRGTDERTPGQTLLNNNDSSNNFGPGIAALPNAHARIEGGKVAANTGAGILAGESSEVVITGVSFNNNAGPGIDLLPNGVTPNSDAKIANGDIDWPEDLRLDPIRLKLVGNAGRGEVVEVFTVEAEPRAGNPDNGEGAVFLGFATADEYGVFTFPPDGTLSCVPSELLTTTATGGAGTSEFSTNLECSYPDAGVADTDRDGVTDLSDQCPDTPPGAAVDESGCEITETTSVDLDYALLVTLDPACNLDFLIGGGSCTSSSVEWPNGAALDCTNSGASVAISGDEQVTGQYCTTFSSPGIEDLDCSGGACTYLQGEGVSCEGPPGSCEITRPDGTQETGCGGESECTVIAADDVVTSLAATASVTVIKKTIGGDAVFPFFAEYRNIFDAKTPLSKWNIPTQNLEGTRSAKIIVAPDSIGTDVSILEQLQGTKYDLTSVACPEEQEIFGGRASFARINYKLYPGDAKTCVFTNTRRTNTPPVANAGPDQTGFIFSPVSLDGSGSSDFDGDELYYEWINSLTPGASVATIEDPTTAVTSFTPDVAGTYQFTLNVSDGTDTSSDDVEFVISAINTPPTADAGNDQSASVGELVQLAGAGFDPDPTDTLEFTWSFVSQPTGSGAVMNSEAGDNIASFTPDLPGSYIVRLTVSDGLVSATDDAVITVTVANTPPIANAGPDQFGFVSGTLQLDGTESTDPDGDELTFEWVVFALPLGSTAFLDDPTSATPTFVPDFAGDYRFQLTVSDGKDTATDQTAISVSEVNTPPAADAGDDQEAFVGDDVQLIGAGFDPDPQDLEFTWTFESTPAGSTAAITSASGDEIASFTPDLVGIYVARLTVTDGSDEDYADVQIRVGKIIDLEYAELTTFDSECSAEAIGEGQYCIDTLARFDNGGILDCDVPGAGIGETGVQQLTGQFCTDFSSSGIEAMDCSLAACTYSLGETLSCEGPANSCDLSFTDGTQEPGCTDLECTVILGDSVVGSPLQRASITVLKETIGADGEFEFDGRYHDIFFNWHDFPTWRIRTENSVGLQSAKIILTPDNDGTLVEFSEYVTDSGFTLTSVKCPEERNVQLVNILLFPDDVKTCVFTNTQQDDTDGDGFPDSEDKCPEFAGDDQGCALIGSMDNLTFSCGVLQTCSISPGGSDCSSCTVEHNAGWWTMACGSPGETGGCFATPGTDTGQCSNGCDIQTPGIGLHCGDDANCRIGGQSPETLTAVCNSAPDGSGCEGTTDSGVDLSCPDGECQITLDSHALQDSSDAIRVTVSKNAVGGNGTFGFTLSQSVELNGSPTLVNHSFELETVIGASIWKSFVLGQAGPFEIAEVNSPSVDWVLTSIICNPPQTNQGFNSVSFGTPLPGLSVACIFTNRDDGPPTIGHQPLPDNRLLAEAVSETPLNLASAEPSAAGLAEDTPHEVIVAVDDGFVVLDPASGQRRYSFTDYFYTPYLGAIAIDNDQVPGADAFITYSSGLQTYRRFIPETNRFSFAISQGIVTTDVSHVGDDPDFAEGVETVNSLNTIRAWRPEPVTGEWRSWFLVDSTAINTATGRAVSAFMARSAIADTTARVLLVKDGQPGTVAIGDPQNRSSAVQIIGEVGDDPRRVRCMSVVCAVSNFGSDTLTIVIWDGGDTAAITSTVVVGDGPVGIDLRLVDDMIEIVSTGFNDNTVTVTTVALDGTVLDSVTSPVETGCIGPGHAIWLTGTNNMLYTCNTSGSYVVTSR